MHTLGSTFIPPGFHAGGLRYHGMSPLVSHCKELGLIEARAYHQNPCFEAGVLFARTEGIVPAPESNHAVQGRDRRGAEGARGGQVADDPVQPVGHGHFDMQAYIDYFAGKLVDQDYDAAALEASLAASAEGGGGVGGGERKPTGVWRVRSRSMNALAPARASKGALAGASLAALRCVPRERLAA